MSFVQSWEHHQAFHKEQWQIMSDFPLHTREEEEEADSLFYMFWFTYHIRCEKEKENTLVFKVSCAPPEFNNQWEFFLASSKVHPLYEHIELFLPLFIVQPVICYMNWNSFCSADLLYLLHAWWIEDYSVKSVYHGVRLQIAEKEMRCCLDNM